MLDDFNNVWIEKTIPCTINQAVKFVIAKGWQHAVDKGVVKIVSQKQLAELQVAAWTGLFPHFQTQKTRGQSAPSSTPTITKMHRYERLRIWI